MSSPNLLNLSQNQNKVNSLAEKHHLTLSAASKLIIILTQAIFVFLLGMNANVVSKTTELENQVKALELQLVNKQASVDRIENVIEKTEKLKTLENERPELATRVKKAIELIPPQVTLAQATIKPDKMEIVIETNSPIDAALLINAYFSQDLADQITLNSANLSTSTQKFITNMEVSFK